MSTLASPSFIIEHGTSPIFAAAVHDGHRTRPEVTELFLLDEAQRRREEDPFTGEMARAVAQASDGTFIIGCRSRFEVDLNRPRDKAVYLQVEDAWGLNVWREPPSEAVIARSLAQYDEFYRALGLALEQALQQHRRVLLYDIHSYNHRRDGADAAAASAQENPEVNVGTATMRDRAPWSGVIERFINDLSAFGYAGRSLDVRENIRFRGGFFPQWIHEQFAGRVGVLSIEFKKFWMDEWSGQVDERHLHLLEQALQSTVPGVLEELQG